MSSNVIDSLFILTLIGLLILIVMLIVMVYRANHVLDNWTKVSDVLSDSLSRLIPAVLDIAVVGKGIHQVLEVIVEHQKKSKK